MRVIRGNLTFSLSYNVLGAAAAIAGLVGPLVAAIAMPISSLIVVTASILQRSFQTENDDRPAPETPPPPRPDRAPTAAASSRTATPGAVATPS